MQPVDTLALSPGLLDDLARAAMDLDALAPLGGTGRQRHSLARDIVRAFGSEPAFLRDLLPTNATALQIDEVREVDASILEELNARYGALLATAQLMVDSSKRRVRRMTTRRSERRSSERSDGASRRSLNAISCVCSA